MEALRWVAGVLLPYVAVTVFVAGMIHRIHAWKKLPSPAVTLFPAPRTERKNVANAVGEALLFRSLFRGDLVLWVMAWTFHAVLALILIGHLRVFTDADALLARAGMSEQAIQAMSSGAGGAAGALILAALASLVLRRVTVARVRDVTGVSDYLILLLLGAIIVTGNMMRFRAEHFDLSQTRSYFTALATFGNAAQAKVLSNSVFVVHMSLAFVLMMVVPFSKILHFGGIFFTHELIRKH